MSIFNFTNRKVTCQKGFLLLEAMVTLCALSILMLGIASSYIHTLIAHAATQERLQAITLATSFVGTLQTARKIPHKQTVKHNGFLLTMVAVQDPTQPHFYWVKVTVTKDLVPVPANNVELICGVCT